MRWRPAGERQRCVAVSGGIPETIPSGNRVPVTVATFTSVGHCLRPAREDRWIPASVCRTSPPLLNHLHPEDLGSSRVRYAWRHRLLRPPLPVSVPPLDFPHRLYERACHTGLSWLGPRPSLFHRCSVSPCHPHSTPGTPTGAPTQFFPADTSLRPLRKGSAIPIPTTRSQHPFGLLVGKVFEAQSVRCPL